MVDEAVVVVMLPPLPSSVVMSVVVGLVVEAFVETGPTSLELVDVKVKLVILDIVAKLVVGADEVVSLVIEGDTVEIAVVLDGKSHTPVHGPV